MDVDLRDVLDNGPGYWIGPLLSPEELAGVKSIILEQLLERIAALAPDQVDAFRAAGLEGYHDICDRIDHASAWTRAAREMAPSGVAYIENSAMLQRLRSNLGGGTITNEGHGLGPEIVWRLVRPGEMGDVQSFHADSWFWVINDLPVPTGTRCIKVWIMLQGEPGQAGLCVEPNSHRTGPWHYEVMASHDYKKPIFDPAAAGLSPINLYTPPGHGVVFSYDLLHGGAPTRAGTSRVSIEFTLAVPA